MQGMVLQVLVFRMYSDYTRHWLDIPRTTTSLGDRAFAVAGPRVWNSLPPAIRDPSLSPSIFGKLLKTYFVCLRVAALVTYELAPWKCTD